MPGGLKPHANLQPQRKEGAVFAVVVKGANLPGAVSSVKMQYAISTVCTYVHCAWSRHTQNPTDILRGMHTKTDTDTQTI